MEQLRGTFLTPQARQTITQGLLDVCHAGNQGTAASVAIAKGTQTMMIMTKVKVAASVAAVLAGLGTGGWMISRAIADKTVSDQTAIPAPAAAPSVAALAPAPAPATQPGAIDLSSPGATVTSFFRAVSQGDRAATYECMTADPNRTATEIDAMLAWNLAQNRLIHAAALTYGDSGSEVRRINTLDSVALLIAAVPPTAEIDGDSATMVVNIPPAVIAMAPAGLQSVLGQWSNATVYFQKQGEQWRLDIDRSLRVEIKLQLRPPEQVDTAVEIGIMTDNAGV